MQPIAVIPLSRTSSINTEIPGAGGAVASRDSGPYEPAQGSANIYSNYDDPPPPFPQSSFDWPARLTRATSVDGDGYPNACDTKA